MTTKKIVLNICILLFLTGCNQKTHEINNFGITQDTLLIEAKTVAGTGLFRKGASTLILMDTLEWKNKLEWSDFEFIYPENLDSIQFGFLSVMLYPLRFYDINGEDTTQINTDPDENSIAIVKCFIEDKEVIIVDENNNHDFRDDQIHELKDFK